MRQATVTRADLIRIFEAWGQQPPNGDYVAGHRPSEAERQADYFLDLADTLAGDVRD